MRTATLLLLIVPFSLLAQSPIRGQGELVSLQNRVSLLVNGSFEEGPDPGEFLPLDEGSTAIKGWTVTKGQIDYIGSYWKSSHGSRSLDLHGSPGFGGIKQTFKTKKGQKYLLIFYHAANPVTQQATRALFVQVADKKQKFTAEVAGKTQDKMGWITRTLEFTAVADETTLEFFTAETVDDFCGPALDNVSVYEVKDPQR